MADDVFTALTSGLVVKAPRRLTSSAAGVAHEADAITAPPLPKKRKHSLHNIGSGLINPFTDQPGNLVAPATGDPSEAANVQRKRHKIKVDGAHAPPPLNGFGDLATQHCFCARILTNLRALGHVQPTAIQMQSIPALLQGRDVLAVAPTGSGKTLAFLLPMAALVTNPQSAAGQTPRPAAFSSAGHAAATLSGSCVQCEGVQGVVVSPTKELSAQTFRELVRLTTGTGVRCCLLQKANAAGTEFNKVQLLCATPLLLSRLINRKRIELNTCRVLVLDEADRLFEMGFLHQVDNIISACTNRHVVRCLFSATLPDNVEATAQSVLREPLRITVGVKNSATTNVKQQLLFVGQDKGRLLALRQLINAGLKPPVLVFVNTKERAKELHRDLLYDGGIRADSIHADQDAVQRAAAINNFRAGRTWILIATDLLGRGIDFLGIQTVVNYDMPTTTTDYIHRIGRTGRGGREGTAISLFVEEDAKKMRGIANLAKSAGSEVPPWLLALPKQPKKRKHNRKVKLMGEQEE